MKDYRLHTKLKFKNKGINIKYFLLFINLLDTYIKFLQYKVFRPEMNIFL